MPATSDRMLRRRLVIHRGIVSYIGKDDVDTDIIMPKQFLVTTGSGNLGRHSFHQWRTFGLVDTFFLKQDSSTKTTVLVVRKNFGCGSSREHAPWSLKQCGFQVLVGISFAEIFFLNCIRNGVLPVVLGEPQLEEMLQHLASHTKTATTVCLLRKRLLLNSFVGWSFRLPPLYWTTILRGKVGTELMLKNVRSILAFENQLRTPFRPNCCAVRSDEDNCSAW